MRATNRQIYGKYSKTAPSARRRRTSAAKRGSNTRSGILSRLGGSIRECRRSGVTQQRLAEDVHFSLAYLSLIERGQRNPPLTTVAAIAAALGTSVRGLMQYRHA